MQISKLFQVLVLGGAVLTAAGSGCGPSKTETSGGATGTNVEPDAGSTDGTTTGGTTTGTTTTSGGGIGGTYPDGGVRGW